MKKHSDVDDMHYTSMINATHFQVSTIKAPEEHLHSKAAPALSTPIQTQQQPPQQRLKRPASSYSPWAHSQPWLPPLKRFRSRYEHSLRIENSHHSLSALIDFVYPPLHCSVCGTMSSTSAEAREHHQQHHQSIPQFVCLHPHCDRVFKTRCALLYHVQQSHIIIPTNTDNISTQASISPTLTSQPARRSAIELTTAPSPQAPVDDYSPSSKLVATQLRKSHVSSPSWRVSSFSKTPASRAPRGSKKIILSPEIDSRLNTIYPPLQCPSCHQQFNRKTNVIKHLTDHHYGEEPYRCVIPGCTHPKFYATREGLVYHTLRVHDSNPQRQQQSHQEEHRGQLLKTADA